MDPLELRKKALKNIQVADHMLSSTYPMVQDPKLLLAVMDNVYLAFVNGIHAILLNEKEKKNINTFPTSFESLFDLFKLKIVPKFGIDRSYIGLIQDLRNTVSQHKSSSVEFVRKDKFVICSEDYKLETVTVAQLKKYIAKSKEFMKKMDELM